jgi:hypothetical protein
VVVVSESAASADPAAPEKPTEQLRQGELGPPLYVLSLPEIRKAEVLSEEMMIDTKDGPLKGRKGDVVMTAKDGGERYPILPAVFYGTYEVLGQVGNRLVVRRLMHVRKAWEVLSPQAEFSYGADRGVVGVARGGWLYQTDETDFGMVSPQEKRKGHAEIGPISKVQDTDWSARFERLSRFLTFLPVVLTALALLSLGLPEEIMGGVARTAFIVVETLLLLAGVAAFAWARRERWEMKAAVASGTGAAVEFQMAAQLLGERGSVRFPQMSLWRAAQTAASGVRCPAFSAENVAAFSRVRKSLAVMVEDLQQKIDANEWIEKLGTRLAAGAVVCVVVSNLWLIFVSHVVLIEMAAMWLPSLIGALHSLSYQKHVSDRVPLLNEFVSQLNFINGQLITLSAWSASEDLQQSAAREAALRLLCRVIGQYSQAELRLAIRRQTDLPL